MEVILSSTSEVRDVGTAVKIISHVNMYNICCHMNGRWPTRPCKREMTLLDSAHEYLADRTAP